MRLFELFDKRYPWTSNEFRFNENRLPNWNAAFRTADKQRYEVGILPRGTGIEVDFRSLTAADPWKLSGSGDAFAVLATVREILASYCEQNNPETVTFAAEGNEPSRVKLYRRMVSGISGYTVAEKPLRDGVKFILSRKS